MSNPYRNTAGQFRPGPGGKQLPVERKQRKKELARRRRERDPLFVANERERLRKYYQETYHLRTYGVSREALETLRAAQGDLCACCLLPLVGHGKNIHVAHDHETREVRGILHGTCNRGIGSLGDNAHGVARALAYLQSAEGVLVDEHW